MEHKDTKTQSFYSPRMYTNDTLMIILPQKSRASESRIKPAWIMPSAAEIHSVAHKYTKDTELLTMTMTMTMTF